MLRAQLFPHAVGPFLLIVAVAAAGNGGSAPSRVPNSPVGDVPAAQSVGKPTKRRASQELAGQVISRVTPHLSVAAMLSPSLVAPGARMSIMVDITPKQGMHVYAPGTLYRAVTIAIEPDPLLKVHETVYPEPSRYLFEPLNEEVLVYASPFRMLVDITAGETPAQQAQLRPGTRRVVKAELEYQACDDTVCYLPVTVLFQWTVRIKP